MKKSQNSSIRKQLYLKIGEDLNKQHAKEDLRKANKYVKRCSTSLAIREMQVKTMMRYHCKPITIVK